MSEPFTKHEKLCGKYEACQEPAEDTSVCFTCGHSKEDHAVEVTNGFTPGDIFVTWGNRIRGIDILVAFAENTVVPLGSVFGTSIGRNDSGKTGFNVMQSYVPMWVRRKGVRTAIQRTLFDEWNFDYVMSPSGTEDGQAWMKKVGYKQDPDSGQWICTREAFALATGDKELLKKDMDAKQAK